jgi:hypothetical protein
MNIFDQLFTNIFWDGEVADVNPDAVSDYYQITDFQTDQLHLRSDIVDAIRSISSDPSKEFFILFGGEVSDGGSGTVNIAECVALGKDDDGVRAIIHLPALTGVSLPSGWNDNRQIWTKLKYDFKLGTLTRGHFNGEIYHYQLLDTYLGDSNGYNYTGLTDLFTDADPGDTVVILGSFTMNGTSFTDLSGAERNISFSRHIPNKTSVANENLFPNKTYYVDSTSQLELTLPVTSSVGDEINIIDLGKNGYKIKQNAGQNILFMNISTVPGTVGFYNNKCSYSSVKLICVVADTTWHLVNIRDELLMKGYFAGGDDGSYTTMIEDMDMKFDLSKVITATLGIAKHSCGGFSGSNKGYFVGGNGRSDIDDLNFLNETSSTLVSTTSIQKSYVASVNGKLKGYRMGGDTGSPVNNIDDFNFSTELSVTITATLDAARHGGDGVSGQTKGYCMGGSSSSTAIDDMNFSNDTSAAIAATLDTGRVFYGGSGISGPTKGYCMGGFTTGAVAVIDDLNFSNETSAAITATLPTARYGGVGVSNPTKGYYMGGSTTAIATFIFLNETCFAITATIGSAKLYGSGVQGYIG